MEKPKFTYFYKGEEIKIIRPLGISKFGWTQYLAIKQSGGRPFRVLGKSIKSVRIDSHEASLIG
jgi:hypothetical protein